MSILDSIAMMVGAGRRARVLAWGTLLCVLATTNPALAWTELDDGGMSDVNAQAGADMKIEVRMNQDAATNQFDCASLAYCRIAASLNNRFDASNRKQWLVMKGYHGSIGVDRLGLDGTDISYANNAASPVVVSRAALTFSLYPDSPIRFRNVGFESLAIETDSMANENDPSNLPGYLAMPSDTAATPKYTSGVYTAAAGAFDQGREVGFMGLSMTGNLKVGQGTTPATFKVFTCPSSGPNGHPRC